MRATPLIVCVCALTASCARTTPEPATLRPEPVPITPEESAPGIADTTPPGHDTRPTFFPVPQDGHAGAVHASAWSPNGAFLATGGFDGTVRLWDPDGRLWIVLQGHRESIRRLVFSPDGGELASAGRDGTIRIWNLVTGRARLVLRGVGWDVAFSPDGSTLATVGPGPGSDSAVRFFRVADGTLEAEVEAGIPAVRQLLSLAYASDGLTLAAAGNGHLVLFDARDRTVRTSVAASGPFAAAPHEPTFWVGGDDGRLTVIDAASGTTLRTLRVVGARTFHHFAFSHDGRWLATAGGYERTAILDAHTGRVRTRIAHTRFVETLAFHPSEDRLAVAGGDTPQIVTYDVPSGGHRRQFGDASRTVREVAFSPDGGRLATAGDDHAEIWDLATGRILGGHEMGRRAQGRLDQTMTHVAWSPDGSLLAVGGEGERAFVLDGSTAALVAQIPFENPQDGAISLAWDASSEHLLAICAATRVRWDRATGHLDRAALGGEVWGRGVTDAEHRHLAVSFRDRAAILEVPSGAVVFEIPASSLGGGFGLGRLGITADGGAIATSASGGVLAVAGPGRPAFASPANHVDTLAPLIFAPDGRLAYATPAHGIGLSGGPPRPAIDEAHDGTIRDLAWLSDGRLATSGDDGRVRVWDVERGARVRELAAHANRVWSLDAHPSRPIVASAGQRVWLSEDPADAVTLRVYRVDGAPTGFFYAESGAVGGDPAAIERFLRVRSGPGILSATLDPIAGRDDPFPFAP